MQMKKPGAPSKRARLCDQEQSPATGPFGPTAGFFYAGHPQIFLATRILSASETDSAGTIWLEAAGRLFKTILLPLNLWMRNRPPLISRISPTAKIGPRSVTAGKSSPNAPVLHFGNSENNW